MILWLVLCGVATGIAHATKPGETQENIAKGKAIYEGVCVFCHGIHGKGDGPAAFFIASYSAPRPRDFTHQDYKFRSTLSGELPTDQDLFRIITNGVPGFMPPFLGLTEAERWNVIAYIKTFNPAFSEETPEPFVFGFPYIPPSPESIRQGRTIYQRFECHVCHGVDGKGNGRLSALGNLKDNRGFPILPTDLTNRLSFKNGSAARDILRSIMTGLNGTPMPSFIGAFTGREEDVWHVVNYILSLSTEPQR